MSIMGGMVYRKAKRSEYLAALAKAKSDMRHVYGFDLGKYEVTVEVHATSSAPWFRAERPQAGELLVDIGKFSCMFTNFRIREGRGGGVFPRVVLATVAFCLGLAVEASTAAVSGTIVRVASFWGPHP